MPEKHIITEISVVPVETYFGSPGEGRIVGRNSKSENYGHNQREWLVQVRVRTVRGPVEHHHRIALSCLFLWKAKLSAADHLRRNQISYLLTANLVFEQQPKALFRTLRGLTVLTRPMPSDVPLPDISGNYAL